MTVTATDIVNQALMLIGGNQTPVTGTAPNFDDSAAGKAARYLYTPCVQKVARQFEWDFARNTIALTLSGNVAPIPWAYEYLYPTNGIQVWQLLPAAIVDANDPLPYNFVVGNEIVASAQKRVIWTNLVGAKAIFNNAPTEDLWDAGFREAVARMLASDFAMAISGKPETSGVLLQAAAGFMGAAEGREN